MTRSVAPSPTQDASRPSLNDLLDQMERLKAEVASLRASLGEPTGAEPVGCPCPGACSATALQARFASLQGGERK